MYLTYTTTLNHSDNEFWEATPRMIFSQIEKYHELHYCGNSPPKDQRKNGGPSIVKGETTTLKVVD